MRIRRFPLALSLLIVIGMASAVTSAQAPAATAKPASAAALAQQQLTPEQKAQLEKQNTEMTQAALAVAQMIDAGKVGEVWDGASPVVKKIVTRDAFVQGVNAARKKHGKLGARGNSQISRVMYPAGAEVPEGLYVNVMFPAQYASAKEPVRELISFRLDEDKVWRVSGYNLP